LFDSSELGIWFLPLGFPKDPTEFYLLVIRSMFPLFSPRPLCLGDLGPLALPPGETGLSDGTLLGVFPSIVSPSIVGCGHLFFPDAFTLPPWLCEVRSLLLEVYRFPTFFRGVIFFFSTSCGLIGGGEVVPFVYVGRVDGFSRGSLFPCRVCLLSR